MILESVSVGPMQVNCYILAKDKNAQAVIIDPGSEERKIRRILDKNNLSPAFIINTHGHYDHIGCDDRFGAPVYIHREDLGFLKDARLNLSHSFALTYQGKSEIRVLEDGQVLKLDSIQLEVLHIPGHTPGGIVLVLRQPKDKIVFSGDSLFCQGIGRSDMPGGDETLLIKSIKERLFRLDDDTVVYPGHGPSTTIGEEKRNNPFLT